MSLSNVQNNNINNTTIAKYVGLATTLVGTAGAAIGGVGEYNTQRKALNKPDEFIKSITEKVGLEKRFCTEHIKGSKEKALSEAKKWDKVLEEAKQFIKNGKIDWKKVGKTALKQGVPMAIGAGVTALFLAGIALAGAKTSKQSEQPVQQPTAEQV